MADARRSRGGWGHPCCPAAKIEQPVTMSSRQILKTSNQKSLSAPATRAGYHSRERASGPSIKSSEHLIDCPLVTCTWDPLYALITFAAHNSQQVGSTAFCGDARLVCAWRTASGDNLLRLDFFVHSDSSWGFWAACTISAQYMSARPAVRSRADEQIGLRSSHENGVRGVR